MNGDLELLMKLQNIDYDLGELERSKEYIPDMIDSLKKEIADSEQKRLATREALTRTTLEMKDLELQVLEKHEKLKKLQVKMLAIKTNKEYDALISEIDQIKEAIANLETRDVELLEMSENYQKEIDVLDKQAEAVRTANGSQLAHLQAQIDSVGSKITGMTRERLEVAGQISQRAMSVYERIRKGKGGAAVVSVKKRACGGCFKSLPPQKMQEVKLGEKLITCDSCGRMLIWTIESEF